MTSSELEVINYHHVGARAANSIPVLKMLGNEQAIWLYDADESCVEQVAQSTHQSPFPTTVRPFFIGDGATAQSFHLNYDPFTSSCFPYNEKMDGAYYMACDGNGDYLFSETLSAVKTVSVTPVSLDSLIEAEGGSVDYLSMDVQGGELGVLKGAMRALEQQCLGISTEINFEELYAGQPLASDIIAFCRTKGFRLMRIDPHSGSSWFRAPIGWRGRGALFDADALFFKDPKLIKESYPHSRIALIKLAMIALIAGYFEYSLECLEMAMDDVSFGGPIVSSSKYVNILIGFFKIFQAEEKIYHPSFAQVYSAEESNGRFQGSYKTDIDYDVVRVRQRYFSRTSLTRFKTEFPKLCSPAPSPMERYLLDNGLALSARAFGERRVEHALAMARLLGLVKKDETLDCVDLSVLDEFG